MFPISERRGKPLSYVGWNLYNPFTGEYDSLEDEGLEKLSYCDALEIDPQIWFRDKSGRECWIKVIYGEYSDEVDGIGVDYSKFNETVLKHEGYVGRVGFADSEGMSKLYRTRGAFVKFRGIERIH